MVLPPALGFGFTNARNSSNSLIPRDYIQNGTPKIKFSKSGFQRSFVKLVNSRARKAAIYRLLGRDDPQLVEDTIKTELPREVTSHPVSEQSIGMG